MSVSLLITTKSQPSIDFSFWFSPLLSVSLFIGLHFSSFRLKERAMSTYLIYLNHNDSRYLWGLATRHRLAVSILKFQSGFKTFMPGFSTSELFHPTKDSLIVSLYQSTEQVKKLLTNLISFFYLTRQECSIIYLMMMLGMEKHNQDRNFKGFHIPFHFFLYYSFFEFSPVAYNVGKIKC